MYFFPTKSLIVLPTSRKFRIFSKGTSLAAVLLTADSVTLFEVAIVAMIALSDGVVI